MRRLACWLALACALGLPARAADAPQLLDDETAVARVLASVDARLALMPQVAAAKWLAHDAVSDPAREQALLERNTAAAAALGLAPAPARELLALQMRFAREAQQRLHAQWRQSGCNACEPPPDLAAVRQRLDALGAVQLRAIHLAAPALAAADFVARHAALAGQRLGSALPAAADRTQLLQALAAMRRTAPPSLARVQASGVLRIATTGDYAPFSLERDGRLSGADIALAQSLAADLGLEAVFVPTSWPTLMPDLAADRFDVALSGISITPGRATAASFSLPYHTGGKTILARCAERARFDTPQELDETRVRVIVNPGGTNEAWVRANLGQAQIRVHPDNRSIFQEIVAGRADAMVTDDVEAELQARRHPELCRTLPGTLTRGEKAVLMPRDVALKAAVDAWLQRQLQAGVPATLLREALAH
jgi:cyclohexadienyl dehydratase